MKPIEFSRIVWDAKLKSSGAVDAIPLLDASVSDQLIARYKVKVGQADMILERATALYYGKPVPTT